jgi:5-methylcytosine-specific restriction protein A
MGRAVTGDPLAMREAKRGTSARGYGWRWQQRSRLFRLRYPLCGMRPGECAPIGSRCYHAGRVRAAEVVDHIRPHRGDRQLFWDEQHNWQALCAECHQEKTHDEQQDWRQRRDGGGAKL